MKACADREELLLARAGGTLDAAAGAGLEAHLASCAGCRAELEALRATLDAVALPPLGARERALEIDLAPRVLRALEARPPRRWLWTASMVGALAAALVGVVVVDRVNARATRVSASEITEADLDALESWALAEDPLPEDPAATDVPETFGEL